jgi:hypothetical protein
MIGKGTVEFQLSAIFDKAGVAVRARATRFGAGTRDMLMPYVLG